MNDSQPCLAVMYHYVRDRADSPQAGIRGLDTAAFTTQLDDLSAEFEPTDWRALHAAVTEGRPMPAPSFLLTFDDGLADHVEIVAPILEKRGLLGLFLVSGQGLDERRLDSAHRIHLLLAELGEDRFAQAVRDWLDRNESHVNWMTRIDPRAATKMYHYENDTLANMKYLLTVVLPIELRNRMTADLFAKHCGDESARASQWYGTWDHWRTLQAAGHTIGGHGYLHEPYVRFTPERQITDAKRIADLLADRLGPGPRPFSYPYGSHDPDAMQACARAGFAAAFTTRPGYITAANAPFALPRVDTIAVTTFLRQSPIIPIGGPT